jgi:hypothetical protein
MKLNLENPIFIFYINIDGMSAPKAKQQLEVLSEHLNYQNITKWIIPVQNTDTKVELIWQGSSYYSSNPGNLEDVMNHLNDLVGIIMSSSSESIREQLQYLQLKKRLL